MSDLLTYERKAEKQGFSGIAGVDEVGRGPLAGPVVACAVILPSYDDLPEGITDSKKLTAKKRDRLNEQLLEIPGIRIGFGVLFPEEIDFLNILRATHEAMRRALTELLPECCFALVDGLPVKDLPVPSEALVKGDSRSVSVAAASILAKVKRDRYMIEQDAEYPGYGFAKHKGYGTREHLSALEKLGATPLHRRSFAPVAQVLDPAAVMHQPEFSFK